MRETAQPDLLLVYSFIYFPPSTSQLLTPIMTSSLWNFLALFFIIIIIFLVVLLEDYSSVVKELDSDNDTDQLCDLEQVS